MLRDHKEMLELRFKYSMEDPIAYIIGNFQTVVRVSQTVSSVSQTVVRVPLVVREGFAGGTPSIQKLIYFFVKINECVM